MFRDDKGKLSMIRIGTFACICLGTIATIIGLVGFFLRLPESILVIGSGEGLIGIALGVKAFQKQAEMQ